MALEPPVCCSRTSARCRCGQPSTYDLRARWEPWLTRQDRQPFRPHVTVQNKVTPAEARRTLAGLAAGFAPFEAVGTGLALWAYRGGPWAPLSRHLFG